MKTKTIAVFLIIGLFLISTVAYAIAMMPLSSQNKQKTSTTPTTTPTPAPSATVAFPVALTDPPSVPPGTTALWLNYSAIELVTNSSPLFMSERGAVNLLKLVNVSEVIAVFNVSKGVAVNQIRFFINSAEIVINGVSYPVFLPSGVIKIPVNNATQGALVDLQPRVVVAQVGQTFEYILTPVATAMSYNASLKLGQIKPLPLSVLHRLNETFSNLSIVSASLGSSGNETEFSITLKNNGASPVVLYAVRVYGEWQTNYNIKFNMTMFGHETMTIGGTAVYNATMLFLVKNGTLEPIAVAPFGGHAINAIQDMTNVNFSKDRVFNFTPVNWFGNAGITIMPGQEVTLNYSGVIAPFGMWHMKPPFRGVVMYTVPVKGSPYNIKLVSAPPSRAEINITAY